MDALELDFMAGLLCMDPARRLTGAQCLAHPYLADLAGTNMGNATTAAMAARARSNCGERTTTSSSNSTTEAEASDRTGDDNDGADEGVHGSRLSSSRGSSSSLTSLSMAAAASARESVGHVASGGGADPDRRSNDDVGRPLAAAAILPELKQQQQGVALSG